MMLEFIHALRRETDDGLTLKQVFQVISFNFRNFGNIAIFLHNQKLQSMPQ